MIIIITVSTPIALLNFEKHHFVTRSATTTNLTNPSTANPANS